MVSGASLHPENSPRTGSSPQLCTHGTPREDTLLPPQPAPWPPWTPSSFILSRGIAWGPGHRGWGRSWPDHWRESPVVSLGEGKAKTEVGLMASSLSSEMLQKLSFRVGGAENLKTPTSHKPVMGPAKGTCPSLWGLTFSKQPHQLHQAGLGVGVSSPLLPQP